VGIWSGDEIRPHFWKREWGFLFRLDDEYWERFERKEKQ
jgi:hypothetical protein